MIRRTLIALSISLLVVSPTRNVIAQDAAKSLTADDVLTMMSVGLSDTVILAKIHQHNKPIDLSTDDLVRLDEVSALPAEYPGWMLERQAAGRRPTPFTPKA